MFENFEVPNELIPSDPRFGVGPSLVPVAFVESLRKTGTSLLGTSHRKPAVISIVKEIHEGLRNYFKLPDDYQIIIGNGGATFFFDMIALGLVDKASAHFVTGEFSNKWFLSHNKVPWIDALKIDVAFGEGLNPDVVAGNDMICTTLNETSTGVAINSIPNLDDDTLLAVDATSGAGQIHLDMDKVDVYFFSPQKIFASEGGTYVAFLSPKAIKRVESIKAKKTYIPEIMNFSNAISNAQKFQTYNTPSISSLFYFNEQLKVMNGLGEEKIIELANKKAKLLYDWANEKEYLSCYVKEKDFRSNCVATINVDKKYCVNDLAKRLREIAVAYDIESYRKLGENQLRISLFHNIKFEDLEKLTKIITLAIES